MTLRSQFGYDGSDHIFQNDNATFCIAGVDFDTGIAINPCRNLASFVVVTTDNLRLDFCSDHFDMYYSVMAYASTVEDK